MTRRENRRNRAESDTEPRELPESEESVFERGTSLGDLAAPADASSFDQTFQVDSSDIEISPDGNIPIAKPWQGIPRAAVVFNLNYIYDEGSGKWIRQKKSDLQEDDDTQDSPTGGGEIGDPGVVGFEKPTVSTGAGPNPTATISFPQPRFRTLRP